MEIVVVVLEPEYHTVAFEGPWVEPDIQDGGLRITTRNLEGEVIGWTVYAQGLWAQVKMTQPPSDEVLRHRAAAAERDKIRQSTFVQSGGPLYGSAGYPAGNSGPH